MKIRERITEQIDRIRECTAWPEGNWHPCCVQHDYDYEEGGTIIDKIKADHRLARCVAGRHSLTMGFIMLAGVSILGIPAWYNHRWQQWKQKGNRK